VTLHLLAMDGTAVSADRPSIERLLRDDKLLWLDLEDAAGRRAVPAPCGRPAGAAGPADPAASRHGQPDRQFFPALPSFLVLGIGSEVVAAAGLFTLFRRRGWF
jgi:hypothetical protein